MAVSFNSQQLKAIDTYRQQNKLGYVISDEQVFAEMKKSGKLPDCFNSLATGATTNSNANQTSNANSNANPSIFGQTNGMMSQPNNDTTTTQTNEKQSAVEKQKAKEEAEMKELGFQNTDGAGKKVKAADGKEYTVVGTASNGRKLVKDSKGQIQVLSHDNKILNKDYVKKGVKDAAIRNDSKVAQQTTVELMEKQAKGAQEAFDQQLAEDGWAGDVADGVSVLWASKNRASVVRKDLKTYNKNIKDLQNAAKKGDTAFNAKFKEIYGIEYNKDAMADYVKNPTPENYQKAFGEKNNIQQRVAEYNESQQKGAAAVKTGTTIAAGVAIGVATGGAGLAAVGVAAAATAGSSVAINASDRLSSDVGLKDGEMKEILKDAAWDGASVLAGGAVGKVAGTVIKGATKTANIARAATNTAGDVAMGAAQEYAQTGEVTAAGTLTNAAFGTVGIAAEAGAFKKAKNLITGNGNKAKADVPPSSVNTTKSTANTPDTPTAQATTQKPTPDATPPVTTQTKSVTQNTSPEATPVAATPPKAEAPAPAQKAETTIETPSVKSNAPKFNTEIMGNKPTSEAGLKNADFTNPDVQNEYIDMIGEQFPDFKRYPKRGRTLNQLQALVNHPDYAKLSDTNKTIAKLSILKDNGIEASDLYKTYKVPTQMKRRIEDIEYCLQSDANKKAAAALYQDGDYATVKILNDVKNPSKIDADGIAEMDSYVAKVQDNGHMMVKHSHIINSKKIPTRQITKNGQTYNVKVLDLTDEKVLANPEAYGFEKGTTADNLKLTVHMNSDFNKAPQMTIKRMMNSKELNLSATITDGGNSLYGHMQQGVVLDYNQGAVSYASNYAAGTGFVKNRQSFAADKLKESASSADTFIKDRFKANMQKAGVEVTEEDYVQLSTMFKGKKMTTNQMEAMFPDGKINVNGKEFSAEQVMKALDDSSNDMLTMRAEIAGTKFSEGFNEVDVYNAEIKAIYIRANNSTEQLEDLISDKLLKFAEDNDIAIVFQRNKKAAS